MRLRSGIVQKLTALVLSWVVPATTVWAAAPPTVSAKAAPAGAAASAPQPGPDLPSFGILVGQALSDATGLPVPGATVRLAGSSAAAQPVDEDGRFGLPAGAGAHVLVAEKDGFVAVERSVTSVAGQGTAVLDPRLTPLGTPTTIGPSGGTAEAGSVTVTVGGGAVNEDTGFIVTPLSGQGLPNRLPLGFAPVLAFDFRAGRAVAGPFAVRLRDLPASASVHLVEYRASGHAWYLTDASLTVDAGVANSSLPGLGAYAVVSVDEDGPALPGPGAPLTGSDPVPSPSGLTGTATVEPLQVPATGATARGRLTASSPVALPSGTVIQARLTESFTFGSVRIEDEPRLHDLVAYRSQPGSGQTLKATIPLTAVRTFGSAEPVTGRLHLEFWTGRPSLAGSVGGGSEDVTVESGPARLVVPAGSASTDTAVSIQSVPLSAFLPTAAGVTALGEVVIDLSGAVLSQSAELSLAASASGTLVIAKVERLSGVPYLMVVSLAELQGGRIVSTGYPGLTGIVRGGRYVFYRLDAPIGFVAGTTTSPTGAVRAVVGTASLPFVGVSSASGSYITASSAGSSIEVAARVPGTPHQATATVAVTAGQTTSQNLALTAGLTTVETVPVDGATGIAVSVSVQLTASQPFDEATITAPHVRLIKGNPDSGPTVATRRLLSADGKTLSVIPESPLEPATIHALRVTGLKDIHGGPVNVADVHFTTRADVTPEYDLGKVKFSFPNDEGIVTVSAANGSFPPASTVMVVNERNGVVLTMMVGNEGQLSGGELPATLDDVMTVSLEDPQGNVVSGRQSKYVDLATGRTAIGAVGGTVEGTGGVELRLPPGAVDRGVVFKADFVNPSSLPAAQRPSLGEATLAAAIRIEAPSQPGFAKEVDIAFPKPADAPAGAFYYVVRKVTGPEGRVFFQTVDIASVEGDKVVTNSYPFTGYDSSYGAFVFGGGGAVAIASVVENVAFLLWTFDQAVPGRARMGVISGRVTRNQWNAATRQWEYVPVEGVMVRRLVGGADPFQSPSPGTTFAYTRDDGTYVLFDATYTGSGFMTVRATDPAPPGQQADATGYGVDVQERPVWAQTYTAMGTANVAFTASTVPAPQVMIRVLEQAGEAWQFSDGLVVANQPIVIGVSVANGTLEDASLDGVPLALREGEDEHLGLQQVADESPSQTGVHSIAVRVRPLAGSPVTETASFLVIGEGGDNNQILPDQPPAIIVPRLVPQPNATAVSPGVFPEVAFTEPVTNVPGNVSLHEVAPGGSEGPALGIDLFGTGPQGVVTGDGFTPTSQVSLLTVQPVGGLKYLTKYRLKLSDAIHDLDSGQSGDPKELLPFALDFETFRSGVVGGSEETFHSAGIVVLEDRAWLVENQFLSGTLRTFDVSDPVEPKEVGTAFGIPGRPVDLAGETDSAAIPGVRRVLVVGQTVTAESRPSNLHVFDVSGDTPLRIGAASVSRDATDGTLSRVEVHGRHAYAITWRQGVQVIDLLRAKENYDTEVAARGDTLHMDQLLHQDHAGFGHDAVVQTIRVTKPYDGLPQQAPHWLLTDLKVGEHEAQTLVYVTGELGFAIVNPQAGNWNKPASIQVGANELLFGYALALGHLDGKDIAVVVGTGRANHPVTGEPTVGPVLAIVNLTEILTPSQPPGPKVLSVIPLFGGSFALASQPTDVILKDHLAIVAGEHNAVVVDLSSLTAPRVTGLIEGIGGRLVLGEGGRFLFSSAWSVTGGASEFGGIRVAVLSPNTPVLTVDPPYALITDQKKTADDLRIKYRIVPNASRVRAARIRVRDEKGAELLSIEVPVADRGEIIWPKGQSLKATPRSIAFELRNPDDSLSNSISGGPVAVVQPPGLTELSPARVEAGSSSFEITLRGRNFSSAAMVGLATAEGDPHYVRGQVLSPTEIRVTVEASWLTEPTIVVVSVWQGSLTSNELSLRVVRPGLPPPPVLQAVEPPQIAAGTDGFWLTLRGERFTDGDSVVKVSTAEDGLTTVYVSTTELRALVPGGFTVSPGPVALHVESRQDPALTSETKVLDVLGVAAPTPALPPLITSMSPQEFAYPTPSSGSVQIEFLGRGFQPGAQLFARLNAQEPPIPVEADLDTEPDKVTATIPEDIWDRMWHLCWIDFDLILETDDGTTSAQRRLAREIPHVAFVCPTCTQGAVEASTFFDRTKDDYLLDPNTGMPQGDTFKKNPQGFELEVMDVQQPNLNDPAKASVTLSSDDSGGGIMDRINNVKMKRLGVKDGNERFGADRQRIAVVSDEYDDGARVATQGRFSPDDNQPKDPTVRGKIRGKLRAVYESRKDRPADRIMVQAEVEICPPALRRTIYLRLINIDGSSLSDQADILDRLIPEAQAIWAQACVDLKVKPWPDGDFVRHVGSTYPGWDPRWRNPRIFPGGQFYRSTATGQVYRRTSSPNPADTYLATRYQMATEVREMMTSTRSPMERQQAVAEGHVTLYFVEQFETPLPNEACVPWSSQRPNEANPGLAFTDTRQVQDVCVGWNNLVPEPVENVGAAIIPGDTLHPPGSPSFRANAKTVAHEIAHVLFNPPGEGDDPHEGARLNILYHASEDSASLLKKRFNGSQIDRLRGGNRFAKSER